MNPAQQQVYRALLSKPSRTIAQLATVTGRSQEQARELVEQVESIIKQRVREGAVIVSQ